MFLFLVRKCRINFTFNSNDFPTISFWKNHDVEFQLMPLVVEKQFHYVLKVLLYYLELIHHEMFHVIIKLNN